MAETGMPDPAALGRVAVLLGGDSAEREISLKSGAEVLRALRRRGVQAEAVDPRDVALGQLAAFDRAFIALHGRGGEDGVIQGALEAMGVAYTGSGVLGSAVGMDKRRSKLLWRALGLPTPDFLPLHPGSDLDAVVARLGLPLMVKPSHEGSSLGMARVDSAVALARACEAALHYDADVFAEPWVAGPEYTVALLGGEALPAIRIEATREFYDFEAKYAAPDTRMHIPCGLEPAAEAALQRLSQDAFDAIGASGWGRVDVMADAEGRFWLLEANTIPGMTDHSLVPAAARAAGIDMEELVWRILLTSLEPGA